MQQQVKFILTLHRVLFHGEGEGIRRPHKVVMHNEVFKCKAPVDNTLLYSFWLIVILIHSHEIYAFAS